MTEIFTVDLTHPGARRLFHFWVHGRGAREIARWGTDGSFGRCTRSLRDDVRDPEGLCAEYHKAATGEWPAEKGIQSSVGLLTMPVVRWRALLAMIGKSTGDKRRIQPGALSTRKLPLPLLWQRESVAGKHDGAVVIGLADQIDITDTFAYGAGSLFNPDPAKLPRLAEDVAEFRYLMEHGLGGPSVDIQMDELTFEYRGNEAVITNGRLAAITLVQVPAFAETKGAFEIYEEDVLVASVGVMRPFEFITLEQWEEKLHPRDAEGKFKEKPGVPGGAPSSAPAREPTVDMGADRTEGLMEKFRIQNQFGVKVREGLASQTSVRGVGDAFRIELRRLGHVVHVSFEGMDVETSKENAEGILRVLEIFPKTKINSVDSYRQQFRADGSHGFYAFASNDGRVSFNRFWNGPEGRDFYLRSLTLGVAKGWHPPGSESVVVTAIHEAAHLVHYTVGGLLYKDERHGMSKRIVEAIEPEKDPDVFLKRGDYGISGYAEKNVAEKLAEALSDVFINGDRASKNSKKIFRIVVEEYEKSQKGKVGEPKVGKLSPQAENAMRVEQAFEAVIKKRDVSEVNKLKREDLLDYIDSVGDIKVSRYADNTELRLAIVKRVADILDSTGRKFVGVKAFVDRLLVRDRENATEVLKNRAYHPYEIAKELGIRKVRMRDPVEELDRLILERIFGPDPDKKKEIPTPVEVDADAVKLTGARVKVGDEVLGSDGKFHRVDRVVKDLGRRNKFRLLDAAGKLIAEVAPNAKLDVKPGPDLPEPEKPAKKPGIKVQLPEPEKPKLVDDDYAKFRYFLEVKRDRAGSVAALAKELGVPAATLGGWLKGRKPRDNELVRKILDGEPGKPDIKINAPEIDRVNNAFDSLIDKRDRSGLEQLSTDDLRAAAKELGIGGLRKNASRDTLIKSLLVKAHAKLAAKPGYGHFVDRLFAVSRTEGRKTLAGRDSMELANIADEVDVDISGILDDETIIKRILDKIHKRNKLLPPPVPAPEPEVPRRSRKFHLNTDGIEDLVARVEGGFEGAQRQEINKGEQGGVKEKITFPDGTKIFSKELALDARVPAKELADREQLASRIGQVVKAPVPRVYRDSENRIYTDWADGAVAWGIFKRNPDRHARVMNSDDAKRIGLLDMLAFNHDRNEGNMLIDRQDNLRGIDHGLAWNGVRHFLNDKTEDSKKNRHWSFAQGPMVDHYLSFQDEPGYNPGDYFKDNPLTKADIAHVRAELKKIETEFEHLDRGDWYRATQETLSLLEPYAKGRRNLIAPDSAPPVPEVDKSANKYDLPSADTSDLAEIVKDLDKAVQKPVAYSGGSGGKQVKVTFPGGKSMFMKDFSEYGDEEEEELIDAEQLGTLVGRVLGAPVPRIHRDGKHRIFTEWIDGKPLGILEYEDGDRAREIFVNQSDKLNLLDVLVGNNDRKGLNMMVDRRDRLHGIDQGQAWFDYKYYDKSQDDEWKFIHLISNKPTKGVIDFQGYTDLTQSEIDDIRGKLNSLRPDFKRLNREKWLDYSLDVLDTLERNQRPDFLKSEPAASTTLPDAVPGTSLDPKIVGNADLTIRSTLTNAKSHAQLNKTFKEETQRITGKPIPFLSKGSLATAREHAEGVLRGLEKFPRARLLMVSDYRGDATEYAIAQYTGNMKFNDHFTASANRKKYLDALARDTQGWKWGFGWHPPGTGSPMGVAVHEFGHIISVSTLFHSADEEIKRVVKDYTARLARKLAKEAKEKGVQPLKINQKVVITKSISEYAKTDTNELIAEAFADVIMNGDVASTLSKEIFAVLEKKYSARYPS